MLRTSFPAWAERSYWSWIIGRTGLENWDTFGVLANGDRTMWSKPNSGDSDAMTPRMIYLYQNWLMINQVDAIHHKVMILLTELRVGTPGTPPGPAPGAALVPPGMLGAVIQDVTADMAKLLGLSESKGALVAAVYKDFSADKAGVKTGDVIVRYGGHEVENAAQLRDMVAATAPDTEVKLVIIRNGKEETLTARLGKPVQVMDFGPTSSGTTVNNDRAEAALNKKVSLFGPVYPLSYPNAPTDKLSVQYAIIEIAKQAGLEYNWDASFMNTDPICRQWVRPNIHDQLCKNALLQILDPVGLTFRIENGQIVLFKK